MKLFLSVWMAFMVTCSFGQVDLAGHFKQLYDASKFDEIIGYTLRDGDSLSAQALYFKGMAHYMKSEDDKALLFFDLAIEQGPADWDMYYYKGMVFYYAEKFSEALPNFDKAISMLPDEPDFYLSKGEAYYGLENLDSALVYFEKASILPGCAVRAFLLMGEIYQEQEEWEKGLLVYKTAIDKLEWGDLQHQNCSFNLGLMQQLNGQFAEAKETFEKHVVAYPEDFHAVAKLIQVYYALSEYEKAKPYRQALYKARENRQLEIDMRYMFCFDQFMWNGKLVMAFENFNEPEKDLFAKHHFFVLTDEGEIDYQIDTETSLAIRRSGPKPNYVLCLVRGDIHTTYWQYVFNEDFNYPDLKAAVLDILNEKVQPGSSFIPKRK